MQCIKQSSTLRVSRKGDKPSPRIVYREGESPETVLEELEIEAPEAEADAESERTEEVVEIEVGILAPDAEVTTEVEEEDIVEAGSELEESAENEVETPEA